MTTQSLAASILTIAVASTAFAARDQVVACDLVKEQAASQVLASAIREHQSDGRAQLLGKTLVSACIFFAERGNLTVKLSEYQSDAEASKAFAAMLQGGAASTVPEAGLGDRAAFFTIGKEASGFVVLKGQRVFLLDSRWRDSKLSEGSKERLRPVADAAARRL